MICDINYFYLKLLMRFSLIIYSKRIIPFKASLATSTPQMLFKENFNDKKLTKVNNG